MLHPITAIKQFYANYQACYAYESNQGNIIARSFHIVQRTLKLANSLFWNRKVDQDTMDRYFSKMTEGTPALFCCDTTIKTRDYYHALATAQQNHLKFFRLKRTDFDSTGWKNQGYYYTLQSALNELPKSDLANAFYGQVYTDYSQKNSVPSDDLQFGEKYAKNNPTDPLVQQAWETTLLKHCTVVK